MLTTEGLLTMEAPAADASVPASPPGHRRRRRDALLVAGLVGLATVLRVPTIGRAYWVDEAISVGIASHPISQFPRLLRQDGSPPLWYVLLHAWITVFGASQVATHTLALLISLAVTPLAWWAGRTLFGPTAGLAAAALSATNPFLNWYATENRMYTLVVVLALVALTFTVRAVRDRDLPCALAAVVAFAALDYTHNWGLYLTATTGGYLLVRAALARDRRLAGSVAAAGAAVLVVYLPWLPSLLEQSTTTAAPWAVPPGIGDFFADPSTALGGTLGVVVVPALALAALATRGSRCRGTGQAAALLVHVTLATTAVGWVVAQVEPSWTVRYLAVTIPGWLLAAAGGLAPSRLGRRVLAGVCVLLAGWSVAGTLWPNANATNAKDNADAVAAAAAPLLHPGDIVVVTQTEQTPVVAHYLPAGLRYYDPMGPVADPTVVDWDHIIHRLQTADACATIEPAVAALPVGAQVLEINPLAPIGASGSAWSEAAHDQVVAVDTMLGREPSLRAERSFTEGTSPKPYSPVIGELFVKTAGPTRCG